MDTIRVWLEPGYDHGRTGAWMLDWPGAFTWGTSREGAMARVPSAVHRFVEWLQEHVDQASAAGSVPVVAEVVDEVPTQRLDDGYQVMATFDADDRDVSDEELRRHIDRLRYARADLLEIIDGLQSLIGSGAELKLEDRDAQGLASGAAAGREIEEVLAHIAQTDAWFVSRLDASARYDGPRQDNVDAFLQQSLEFLLARLTAIQAADPRAKRVDGRGETWTLAKLLRRTLYHALDHLEELRRRFDIASGAIDRLELRKNAQLDVAELRRLFARAGLGRRAGDSDELTRRIIAGSTETVSAWDGERLVGFGRVISDEATNAYISTIAVAPRWQERGLGTRLMRALMDGRDGLKFTLDAREGAEGFYERLGFRRVHTAMVRPRQAGGGT